MSKTLSKQFASHFSDGSAAKLLVEQPRIFSDLPDAALDSLPEKEKEILLQKAADAERMPIPLLPAREYAAFRFEGNRSRYEAVYFQRREMLLALTIGTVLDERYFLSMVDVLWVILEETTWVLPACQPEGMVLPDCDEEDAPLLDLFAAATAGVLAFLLLWHRKRLDAYAPTLTPRIERMLRRRVIKPLMKEDEQFWKNGINNWTPWILSNVYTVLFALPMPLTERKEVVERTLPMLAKFVMTYHDDGGCDEGPSYWNKAGASLFDCCELLFDLTNGTFDLFGNELLRRMGEYVAKAYIHGNYFLNFADAPGVVQPEGRLITRFGRRIQSETLEVFGRSISGNPMQEMPHYSSYRTVKNLLTAAEPVDAPPLFEKVWLDGLQVMALRQHPQSDKGFYLACKGGCNGENHNHNDVGNFVVYQDGRPLLVDLGVGTYCKATFAPELRYTIFSMQSSYHNLFEIDGMQQQPGTQYAAKEVAYTGNAVSMELRDAMPAACGVKSWKRSVSMEDGGIEVSDAFTLAEEKPVRFFLILLEKPEIHGHSLVFSKAQIQFDAALRVKIEEIEFTDERFIRVWQTDRFYRIILEPEKPIEAGAYSLSISQR